MPGINGTGPQGAGKMTGRGLGYCNKTNVNTSSLKRRMGRGHGCGRGFGFKGFYEAPELTPEQQKEILAQQKSYLQRELAGIDNELEKL